MSARQRAYLALLLGAVGVFTLAAIVYLWSHGWLVDDLNAARPRISVLAFVGSALSLALTIHAFTGRDFVLPITLLGWAPSIFVAAQIQMWSPIVHGPDEVSWGVAVVPALLSPVLAALLAPRVAALRVPLALPIALAVVVALLVGLGFARLHAHPDPDQYFDTLAVRGTVEDGPHTEIAGLEMQMGRGMDWHQCWLGEVSTPRHVTNDSLTCGRLTLLRDDPNDMWILRPTTHDPGDAALRGTPPRQIDPIYAFTIHKSLAPPVGWVHGAAGGLVLALIVLLTTKRRLETVAILAISSAPLVVAAANRLVV